MKTTLSPSTLVLIFVFLAAVMWLTARYGMPNAELARRKEMEAIKVCTDMGGTLEFLYTDTFTLRACNVTPGRVEIR